MGGVVVMVMVNESIEILAGSFVSPVGAEVR